MVITDRLGAFSVTMGLHGVQWLHFLKSNGCFSSNYRNFAVLESNRFTQFFD